MQFSPNLMVDGMNGYMGYLIIICYGLILFAIYKSLNIRTDKHSIYDFILLKRNVPFNLIAPSIFNTWLWATSIIGAAEAVFLYGVSGGLAYAFGAGVGFIFLLPLLLILRRIMPDHIYMTNFIKFRFSPETQMIFWGASILVVVYIAIEQAVGIGVIFSGIFDVSFKKISFICILISLMFVLFSGMKGVLYNDFINFFFILTGILTTLFLVVSFLYNQEPNSLENIKNIYIDENNSYEEISKIFSIGAVKYAVIAIIIAFAQSTMDPGLYLKGYISKDKKALIASFVFGGVVMWIPIVIISSIVFGYLCFYFNVSGENFSGFTQVLAKEIIAVKLPLPIQIIFSCTILTVAMTTIINCFMGILGLSIIEISPSIINNPFIDEKKIKFGFLFTILISLFCGLIAISLENISLLSIDIFSGIFFATPAGVIIMGLISNKKFGNLGIVAFCIGIVMGFSTWILVKNNTIDWFYSTLISFFSPMVFLMICQYYIKENCNFVSLKHLD